MAQAGVAGAEIVEQHADAKLLDPLEHVEHAPFIIEQDSSVTSSSSSEGASPVASSSPATECARSPESSCKGERLMQRR
jgi:hypothetical protein